MSNSRGRIDNFFKSVYKYRCKINPTQMTLNTEYSIAIYEYDGIKQLLVISSGFSGFHLYSEVKSSNRSRRFA